MIREFHTRFRIEVPITEVHQRFMNRVLNQIFDGWVWGQNHPHGLKRAVVTALGDRDYDYKSFDLYINGDFRRCLIALEGLYAAVNHYQKEELGAMIEHYP